MKVAIIKETLQIGGTERSAANISLALEKRYDVSMVLYDGNDPQYDYGGVLYNMRIPARTNRIFKILDHLHRIVYFYRYYRKDKPDVIFMFISFRHPLAKISLKDSIKIISARDYSILSGNAYSFHKLLKKSDALVCNSKYMKDFYVNKFPNDAKKVFTMENVVDIKSVLVSAGDELCDSRFDDFRKRHKYIIVSTGRFCKEKAFENLILAVARCKTQIEGIGLLLVGDGDYKNEYMKIINMENVQDHVFFSGYRRNPYNYMSKCDIFVLSSISEGFPNVLIEAMALHLPVISINCISGPAEILMSQADYNLAKMNYVEADYGILTPHYNSCGTDMAITKMSEAIRNLIEDPAKREKYKHLAFDRACQYSYDAGINKFDIIISKIKKENRYDV